jgi:hypothetical protein
VVQMKGTKGGGGHELACWAMREKRGHALMPRGWNSMGATERKRAGWLCQKANLGGDARSVSSL